MSAVPATPASTPTAATLPTVATTGAPTLLTHQIAGHAGQILSLPNGLIAKVCPIKEKHFYEHVFHSPRADLVAFQTIIPKYAGVPADIPPPTTPTGEIDTTKAVIQAQDVLRPFTNPSVADIKIGTRLYGTEADAAKQARMEHQAAITTSGATGLRICGTRVFRRSDQTSVVHDRTFGRALTVKTLPSGVDEFFSAADIPDATQKRKLVEKVAAALRAVLAVLEKACVRLYGASLLVVYGDDDEVDVKIIDFAHSHVEEETEGPDEGAVFGVKYLIRILEELADDRH
ncbi:uncharacterized protein EV422DRAFT_547247 [Fimicolochytrium jonesii]|uniref:uncharacterized protein n=1 Tax=Fimicolochytrium jonesii TaxID=1396493 RepID=UPI0022FE026E|nr:uncharacterized protein EV422DRAFT_547247 [Fimicolochytrium jonesii]KAI8816075.1 hypothetical protein EV422DRAFT_547247 [Fimicolochytrium jonesii]